MHERMIEIFEAFRGHLKEVFEEAVKNYSQMFWSYLYDVRTGRTPPKRALRKLQTHIRKDLKTLERHILESVEVLFEDYLEESR